MAPGKKIKINNKISWIIVLIVVLCSFFGVYLAMNRFSQTIRYELYKERSYHLSETMTVVADKASIVIDNNWHILESAQVILNDSDISDTASIADTLDYISKIHPENDSPVVLIDDQRNCYRNDIDNGKTKWVDYSLLLNDTTYQIAMEESTSGASSSGTYLIFLLKLDNAIVYNEATITHVGLIQDMNNFKEMFLSNAYDNKNETILTNIDGTRFYYDTTYSSFTGYNILNILKKGTYLFDSDVNQLVDNFTNGIQGTAEVKLDGDNYFIGYTSLNEDWRYIIVVPEEYVSINTTSFSSALFNGFILFGSLIVGLIAVVIFTVLYAVHKNRKMELVQNLNQQLTIANNQAKEAEKAANEANRAKSEFLSNMSHDIRTPINGIIGMLDIADLHTQQPEELPQYLTRIRGITNHLLILINDVLDMSKAESGKIELTNESFVLKELVQECSDITKGRMLQRQLDYKEDLTGIKENYLSGSSLYIKRILLNVLGNAVKYTNDGGHIVLTVSDNKINDNQVMVKFVVQDDGIGMSKEFQKHIFESFTREDNSPSSQARGTGLGMAISKKLVDLMQGDISVESEVNKGSIFTITLPLDIDKQSNHKISEVEQELDLDISGMNILLVEDNDLNREIAKTLLEEEKANITEALNGQEAIDIFKDSNNKFDVILMDVMMPVKDGLQAAKEIRELDKDDSKTIPIIAMTANAFSEDIKKTKEAGMNEHLSKPLNIQQLIKTIAKYKQNK